MDSDTQQIHALIAQYCASALNKDAEAFLRLYEERVRIFDMWNQPCVRGMAEWAPAVRNWLGSLGTESVHVAFEQVELQVERDLAVLTAFVHYQARDPAGAVLRKMMNRLTWALVRHGAAWRIVHQHTSIPIDSKTIAPKFNGAEYGRRPQNKSGQTNRGGVATTQDVASLIARCPVNTPCWARKK